MTKKRIEKERLSDITLGYYHEETDLVIRVVLNDESISRVKKVNELITSIINRDDFNKDTYDNLFDNINTEEGGEGEGIIDIDIQY